MAGLDQGLVFEQVLASLLCKQAYTYENETERQTDNLILSVWFGRAVLAVFHIDSLSLCHYLPGH